MLVLFLITFRRSLLCNRKRFM